MTSQWAAVGAETDPLRRARELQRSWEQLLAEGALGPELSPRTIAGLRPTIVESWRRSLATGLDPTDLLAPIEADESEVLERWFEHPLGSLAHVLAAQLGKVAEDSRGVVVVTDASGLVLHRVGDEWLKERAAAEMNLVEGAGIDALTNVAKHSSAGHAEVVAQIDDGTLRVEVSDGGVGGASPDGPGLVGLADRLAVLDGRLEVDSPPGGGTRLTAAIPL